MKARYVGDPRYRTNPQKAGDPAEYTFQGKTFKKGDWVTIDDKDWAEKHRESLRKNSHFEVDSEPAAPGLKTYEEDANWRKAQEDAKKAQAEKAKHDEALPGHAPDHGGTGDIGQTNPEGEPEALVPEAMTQGFGSVDSPTQSPSRDPRKKDRLMRERAEAIVVPDKKPEAKSR